MIAPCDALIDFGDLSQVVAPAASRLSPGGLVAFTVERGGQRFLMIKDNAPAGQTATATPAGMVVVLNWSEELKQRVPVK